MNLAVPSVDERWQQERAADNAALRAQSAKAKRLRLGKLARKDKDISHLLDEHTSLVATAAELRRQLATANTRREIAEQSLADVRSELTLADSARATLKAQLASALKPKR